MPTKLRAQKSFSVVVSVSIARRATPVRDGSSRVPVVVIGASDVANNDPWSKLGHPVENVSRLAPGARAQHPGVANPNRG